MLRDMSWITAAGFLLLGLGTATLVAIMRVMRLPVGRRPAILKKERFVLGTVILVLATIMGGLVMVFAGAAPEATFSP